MSMIVYHSKSKIISNGNWYQREGYCCEELKNWTIAPCFLFLLWFGIFVYFNLGDLGTFDQ